MTRMDDKKALLAAVADAASASASAPGQGDESSVEQYESLLAYVKRHSSRWVWWGYFWWCDCGGGGDGCRWRDFTVAYCTYRQ